MCLKFTLSLIFSEAYIRGAYIRREICVSDQGGLHSGGLYSGRLIFGAHIFGGLIFVGAYIRDFTVYRKLTNYSISKNTLSHVIKAHVVT